MSQSREQVLHYSSFAKLLHWLIAGLIVGQFVLAKLAELAEEHDPLVQQILLIANHKSLGMTVFMLAIVRLIWRLVNPPPALPAEIPAWQMKASVITHRLLYGLIFLIPLSGWLMSSASAYSVSWFNLFVFPDLIGSNELLVDQFHTMHEALTRLLFVLVMIHVCAALKHHFLDRNQTLVRMSSKLGYLLMVTSVAISVIYFGRLYSSSLSDDPQYSEEPVADQAIVGSGRTQAPVAGSLMVENDSQLATGKIDELKSWKVDYSQSQIKFSGIQAGAPFSGEWQRWKADIKFDPNHLKRSSINVEIDIASVNTENEERDEAIMGTDFFDLENYPTASFSAVHFTPFDDQEFSTMGLVTIKGIGERVVFKFKLDNSGTQTIITGKADLHRFDWNIGLGEWGDTTWLGQDVTVEVIVVASQ